MSKKDMPRSTHVTLRGKTYYFRMRVPADLVEHYKKQEITFSLQTKELKGANRKAHEEALRFLNEFDSLRQSTPKDTKDAMGHEEILQLAQGFHDDLLEADTIQRRSGFVSKEYRLAIDLLESHAKPVFAGEWHYDNGEGHRWFANHVRQEAKALNLNLVPDSELERDLIYYFAEASVRALETITERDKGKPSSAPIHVSATALSPSRSPSEDKSVRLSTIIEAYSREQENAGNWTGKTGPENRAIFKLLIDVIGDMKASELGYDHARAFKTTLQGLPANINKNPKYRGKIIADILATPDVVPMSITTANKYLTRVSGLFEWTMRHGHIAQNYASKLLIPQRGKKASDRRDMFEAIHLEAIFRAISEGRVSSGKVFSFHYWAPLLGYFTAGRINEIASLRLSDFKEDETTPYISITQQNDGEKETKTDAGKRDIPLHPALIRLGLLKHVENLKARGETRLFPELKMTKNGYGGNITRWFSSGHNSKTESFLWRDAGIKESKLVFHSFRHTMATMLERAETREVLTKRIMGHTLEDDVTAGTYSKGPILSQLRDAIVKAIPETLLGNLSVFEQWRS